MSTNWHQDLSATPARHREATPAPITWMRPDPRPRPTAPVRRPERPRPLLRLADGLVEAGERLALYLAGVCIGAALVVLVNQLTGGA